MNKYLILSLGPIAAMALFTAISVIVFDASTKVVNFGQFGIMAVGMIVILIAHHLDRSKKL